ARLVALEQKAVQAIFVPGVQPTIGTRFGEHPHTRVAHLADESGRLLDGVEIDDQPGQTAANERTQRVRGTVRDRAEAKAEGAASVAGDPLEIPDHGVESRLEL